MKKCINCQSHIENNAKTCMHCGAVQPYENNLTIKIFIIGLIITLLFPIIMSHLFINNLSTNSSKEESNTEINADKKEDINATEENQDSNNIINYNPDGKQAIKVYEFYGVTCSHCMSLNSWFQTIEDEYGMYFDLVQYEVFYDEKNEDLMNDVATYLNINAQGVPFVVIGDKYILGFSEMTTPDIITKYIMDEYNKDEKERIDVIEIVKNN